MFGKCFFVNCGDILFFGILFVFIFFLLLVGLFFFISFLLLVLCILLLMIVLMIFVCSEGVFGCFNFVVLFGFLF